MAQSVALSKTSSMTFLSFGVLREVPLLPLEPEQSLPQLFFPQNDALAVGAAVKASAWPAAPATPEAENLLVYNSTLYTC